METQLSVEKVITEWLDINHVLCLVISGFIRHVLETALDILHKEFFLALVVCRYRGRAMTAYRTGYKTYDVFE